MVPASQAWENSCLPRVGGVAEARLDLETCLGGDHTLPWKLIRLGVESSSLILLLVPSPPQAEGDFSLSVCLIVVVKITYIEIMT